MRTGFFPYNGLAPKHHLTGKIDRSILPTDEVLMRSMIARACDQLLCSMSGKLEGLCFSPDETVDTLRNISQEMVSFRQKMVSFEGIQKGIFDKLERLNDASTVENVHSFVAGAKESKKNIKLIIILHDPRLLGTFVKALENEHIKECITSLYLLCDSPLRFFITHKSYLY